jgi:hypothetical protein
MYDVNKRGEYARGDLQESGEGQSISTKRKRWLPLEDSKGNRLGAGLGMGMNSLRDRAVAAVADLPNQSKPCRKAR